MFYIGRNQLFMKKYKSIGKFFNFNASYQPNVNFPSSYWLNQFFTVVDRDSHKIYIYDSYNTKLIQVYDSPVIYDLIYTNCNKAQSLLLCRHENHKYSVIKPVC